MASAPTQESEAESGPCQRPALYVGKKGTVKGVLYLQKQAAYQGGVALGQVLGGAEDAGVDFSYNLRLTR